MQWYSIFEPVFRIKNSNGSQELRISGEAWQSMQGSVEN
jgi:hypothetical protein